MITTEAFITAFIISTVIWGQFILLNNRITKLEKNANGTSDRTPE